MIWGNFKWENKIVYYYSNIIITEAGKEEQTNDGEKIWMDVWMDGRKNGQNDKQTNIIKTLWNWEQKSRHQTKQMKEGWWLLSILSDWRSKKK